MKQWMIVVVGTVIHVALLIGYMLMARSDNEFISTVFWSVFWAYNFLLLRDELVLVRGLINGSDGNESIADLYRKSEDLSRKQIYDTMKMIEEIDAEIQRIEKEEGEDK